MYYYIIPFLVYVLSIPFMSYNALLIGRVVVLALLLVYFKNYYKFKLKLEMFPVFIGIIIFLLWILLEGLYPLLGSSSSFIPTDTVTLLFRVFAFVLIAPIIEEFFTRNFLARILVSNNWKKVPLGKFTTTSFIITVAFFGFSHNRWFPGLIAGVLLNYLMYKEKNMSSVIIAHATANILLTVYIIYTKSWFFW